MWKTNKQKGSGNSVILKGNKNKKIVKILEIFLYYMCVSYMEIWAGKYLEWKNNSICKVAPIS